MKRFLRNDLREVAGREPGWPRRKLPGRRDDDSPRRRAPAESKYFVLAAAALIGLGIGWLSGKAISGWLPAASPTMAIAERAVPATNPAARDDLQSAPPATSREAAPDGGSASVAPTEPDGSVGNVAQATNDELARGGRRVGRHGYRRHARGQFLFRPFKVFRKLKIW
jgi:hypothetical protein